MSSLHQTQTQSSETNRKSETNRNTENWKYVANGPSRRSTESLKSNSITVSYRYNNLYVEENLNNPQDNFSNDADNDENFNVISKHERECKKKLAESATSYKRPNPVVNPHPEREFYLKKRVKQKIMYHEKRISELLVIVYQSEFLHIDLIRVSTMVFVV